MGNNCMLHGYKLVMLPLPLAMQLEKCKQYFIVYCESQTAVCSLPSNENSTMGLMAEPK